MKNFSKLTSLICIISILFGFSFNLSAEDNDETEVDYAQIALLRQWNSVSDEERYYFDINVKAAAVGLTPEDYLFFSRVVECESAGGDNFEDRVLVACTIINRVNDGRFGKSLFEILTRPGQFLCVTKEEPEEGEDEGEVKYTVGAATLESDWAIIEAYRRIANGDEPTDMLYFNSVGFDRHKYDYVYTGGNYFSTETPNRYSKYYDDKIDELDEQT